MLKQLQVDFYQDVLNPKNAKNYLANGRFTAVDLMHVYHNNYFSNLTSALEKTYSCVLRLVGKKFFNMLAKDFIKKNPFKNRQYD
ncbi:hypothetical protein CRYPA_27 [uncultured Candidatus Thioglobus sp.]|nr:hypothetical protein CRYPA_27 [uncultured Candidatus Thioglobus sp.]